MNKNIGRFILDSMMLALFMSLLALPVAGFGLFSVQQQNEVLGLQTYKTPNSGSKAVSTGSEDYKTVVDDYVIKQYNVRTSNFEPISGDNKEPVEGQSPLAEDQSLENEDNSIEYEVNSTSEIPQSTSSQDLTGN